VRPGYYWKEALAGMRRAKLMSLLSVSTISAALFLLGAFLLVTINFRSAVSSFKDKFEIQAFLAETCDQHQALVAGSYIREIPGVADAVYISKEEALRRFRAELADKADLLQALETNPLPRSYRVILTPDQRDPEAMARIAEKVQRIPGIEDTEYGRDWLGRFYRLGRLLVMLDVALLLVVSLASVIVIFCTPGARPSRSCGWWAPPTASSAGRSCWRGCCTAWPAPWPGRRCCTCSTGCCRPTSGR